MASVPSIQFKIYCRDLFFAQTCNYRRDIVKCFGRLFAFTACYVGTRTVQLMAFWVIIVPLHPTLQIPIRGGGSLYLLLFGWAMIFAKVAIRSGRGSFESPGDCSPLGAMDWPAAVPKQRTVASRRQRWRGRVVSERDARRCGRQNSSISVVRQSP